MAHPGPYAKRAPMCSSPTRQPLTGLVWPGAGMRLNTFDEDPAIQELVLHTSADDGFPGPTCGAGASGAGLDGLSYLLGFGTATHEDGRDGTPAPPGDADADYLDRLLNKLSTSGPITYRSTETVSLTDPWRDVVGDDGEVGADSDLDEDMGRSSCGTSTPHARTCSDGRAKLHGCDGDHCWAGGRDNGLSDGDDDLIRDDDGDISDSCDDDSRGDSDECKEDAATLTGACGGATRTCNFPGCNKTRLKYSLPRELLLRGSLPQNTTCKAHWTFIRRCTGLDAEQRHRNCVCQPTQRCRDMLLAWEAALPRDVAFLPSVWGRATVEA